MSKVSGSVRLRPTRIGLLVRPSQSNHMLIRRFLRLCACLWGGRYNPIIPVARTLPSEWKRRLPRSTSGRTLADGYIDFFEPDVFVEAEPGLAEEVGIVSGRHFDRRVVPLSEFVVKRDTRGPDFAFGLNVFDVYKHRYDRELQFVRKHTPTFAAFEKADSTHAFFELVFGVLPSQKDIAYVRDAYVDAFEPKAFSPTPESALEVLRERHGTPLLVTRFGLDREPGFHNDLTIYFFDSSKTVDVIDFWNLVLWKANVIPVDISWVRSFAPFLRGVITKHFRPIPGNAFGTMFTTHVEFGRSVSHSDAQVAASLLKDVPDGSVGYPLEYVEPFWAKHYSRHLFRPRPVRLTAAEEDFETAVDTGTTVVSVPSLAPEFAQRFGAGENHARWANVLRISSFSAAQDRAPVYPTNVRNTDYPRIAFGTSAGIVTREGFVLPQQHLRLRNSLSLQRHEDAIIGWLKARGIEAEVSSAGRNAEQVIRSVGGLDSGILAHEGTLQLLDRMAKTVHESKDGTAAQFPDRTARITDWMEVVGRRREELPRVALSDFTDKSIIRLGVVVSCPRCEQENWYDLTRVDYLLQCERCLGEYKFPQGDLRFGEQDWRFRVVGPFSLPNFAHGAYSTALTLRVLSQGSMNRASMTWCPALTLKRAGVFREVDFIAWYCEGRLTSDDREPAIVFGETKSFGTDAFQNKDVERMRELGEAFPGSFLLFSTLKRQLSPDERSRLQRLARWSRVPRKDGTPRAWVTVLTGNELFFTWSVGHTWKKLGGKHARIAEIEQTHLGDPATLADLTQQLYLDMPSLESELGRRRRWPGPKSHEVRVRHA